MGEGRKGPCFQEGLSNQLQVIDHYKCKKELAVGTLNGTRRAHSTPISGRWGVPAQLSIPPCHGSALAAELD